jgi:hypothetical protein
MSKTKKHRNTLKNTHFTKDHYDSKNGFCTDIWGGILWFFLHISSFNYPNKPTPEDKFHYRNLVLSLQKTLPCGVCKLNISKNLKKLPLTDADLENRDTYSRYIYKLHETVNHMLKKKSNLTYEEVRDRFENFRARCNKKTTKHHPTKKSHVGCSEPLTGHIKSKCVIKIVPKTEKCDTLNISKKCIPKVSKKTI